MSTMDGKGMCRGIKSQGMLKATLAALVLVLVLQLYSSGQSRMTSDATANQIAGRAECEVKDDGRDHQREALEEARRLLLPHVKPRADTKQEKTAVDPVTSEDSGKKQVLLISYGRTGTTYTSAVISHNSDVFYTAEPLHRMPPEYGIYERPLPERTRLKAVDTIRAFLECDLLSIDPVAYSSIVFNASNSTKGFRTCISKTMPSRRTRLSKPPPSKRSKRSKVYDNHLKYPHKQSHQYIDPLYYVRCFLSMWKTCQKSHVTYVKTIRTRMWWARQLLDKFPRLKVLYLVRDPRATLYSQSTNFATFDLDKSATGVATSYCADMRDDLVSLANLTADYPGRLMALRYEDGATEPMQFAKNIYRFLGFDYDQGVQDFVSRIASSSKNAKVLSHNSYGYEKRNSTETMNRWRWKALFPTVMQIDHVCKDLYPALGYVKINNTNQLTSDMPLTTFGPFQGMFSAPKQPT